MSRKRTLWTLACLLGVGLLAGYFVGLPLLVHWQLAIALREAGVENITFDVSSVGISRSQFTDIKTRSGATLKRLAVSYGPMGLKEGRVNTVRIEGLELTVDCKDGRASLGVIDEVLSHRKGATTTPTTRAATTQPLPFDRITIADSVILLRTPQQNVRLPLAGTLTVQPDGKLLVSADVQGANAPIHLIGTIEPAVGWVDLRATCDALDVPGLMAILQGLVPTFTPRLTGDAGADLRYVTEAGGNSLRVRLEPKDLVVRVPYGQERVTKLQAEKGVLNAEVAWKPGRDPFMTLSTTDLTLASDDNAARAEGLTVSLAYGPGMETSRQSITIRSAQVGQMKTTNGSATFQMDTKHVVRIEQTQWTWFGGTLSAKDVTIAPGSPTDVTINGRAIELKPLLDAFGSGKVSGEGLIDLNLPMRIDWPRIGFAAGSAQNVGSGTLKIAEAGGFADAVAGGSAGKRQYEQDKIKRDVVEALQDFEYHLLRVNLRPSGDALFADVHLAGNGRTGAKKALDMELHLSNVDDLVEFYLGISGKMSGQ